MAELMSSGLALSTLSPMILKKSRLVAMTLALTESTLEIDTRLLLTVL